MSLRVRFLSAVRRVRPLHGHDLSRGVALRGSVWTGGDAEVLADHVVIVAGDGSIAAIQPASARLPEGLRSLGSASHWVGPGVIDAHVHLAFGSPERVFAGGVVGVRDLGAPPRASAGWRGAGPPCCAVAGPVITAPGGYPSTTWGARGFASFADSPAQARALVRSLVADGVDLVKVALEPNAGGAAGGSAPVPGPEVLHALVDAAHEAGLPVTAHALTVGMVTRALDAGVDELAHTPVERLGEELVMRIVAAGIPVVSTLQTFFSGGEGRVAAANAAALHAAGGTLLYGTDLGNTGTSPGVDPRELDRLALAGLGRLGALRRAAETGALSPGFSGPDGRLQVGAQAALVLLPGDPIEEPAVWRVPTTVIAGGRQVGGG
jgi:imidazolonepropionase-like amidohydrolase